MTSKKLAHSVDFFLVSGYTWSNDIQYAGIKPPLLQATLQGIVGLFFGIEQWSIVISFYITAHERSLVRHKDTVTEQGAKLANAWSRE